MNLCKHSYLQDRYLKYFPFLILNGFFTCIDSALIGRSSHTTAFDETIYCNTLPTQCKHIEPMHEGVWFENIY